MVKVIETVHEIEKKFVKYVEKIKEEIKSQLGSIVKKTGFRSQLGQHGKNKANLADVNKDVVILEGKM